VPSVKGSVVCAAAVATGLAFVEVGCASNLRAIAREGTSPGHDSNVASGKLLHPANYSPHQSQNKLFGNEPLPGEDGFDTRRFSLDWRANIPTPDAVESLLTRCTGSMISKEQAEQLRAELPSIQKDFKLAVLNILDSNPASGSSGVGFAREMFSRTIVSPLLEKRFLTPSEASAFADSPLSQRTCLLTLALQPERSLKLLGSGATYETYARLLCGADSIYLAEVNSAHFDQFRRLPLKDRLAIVEAADNLRSTQMARGGGSTDDVTRRVSGFFEQMVRGASSGHSEIN